jgi:p-aminobenzoyl-glutamate transporter AbgT
MKKMEWAFVALLVLLSNSITLFVVQKYMTPKFKVVDLIKVLETDKKGDLQNVLSGKMTQDEYIAKHKDDGKKIADVATAQNGIVLIKQCVLGSNYDDITPIIESNLSK